MIKNKIITLTFLFSSLFILSSCNENKDGFEVKGKLENVVGDTFYAAREVGDSLLVDTVHIDESGKFSFSGKIDSLTVISLYFNKNTKSTYFLVDKGWKVNVKGDVDFTDLIRVKGGEINDDLTAFKEANKDLLKERAAILNGANLSNTTDSVLGKSYTDIKNINFELSNIAAKYVRANPSKIASVILINIFFRDENSITRLDENLRLLEDPARSFPITTTMRRYSEKVKKSSVGATAPNFSLKDTKGNKVNLYDYRGKHLFLSFVATTCDICRFERKASIEAYKELREEKLDIEFLTVVIDSEIKDISKNATDSIKWKMLIDDGGWAAKTIEQYNIEEIPYSILISPMGEILERNVSPYTLPAKVKEMLEKS